MRYQYILLLLLLCSPGYAIFGLGEKQIISNTYIVSGPYAKLGGDVYFNSISANISNIKNSTVTNINITNLLCDTIGNCYTLVMLNKTQNLSKYIKNDTSARLDTFSMTAKLGDRISIYDNRLGTTSMYGLGVETSTLYMKSNGNYRWYSQSNADGGASDIMELQSNGNIVIQGDITGYGDDITLGNYNKYLVRANYRPSYNTNMGGTTWIWYADSNSTAIGSNKYSLWGYPKDSLGNIKSYDSWVDYQYRKFNGTNFDTYATETHYADNTTFIGNLTVTKNFYAKWYDWTASGGYVLFDGHTVTFNDSKLTGSSINHTNINVLNINASMLNVTERARISGLLRAGNITADNYQGLWYGQNISDIGGGFTNGTSINMSKAYANEYIENGVSLEDKYEPKSTEGRTVLGFDQEGRFRIKVT